METGTNDPTFRLTDGGGGGGDQTGANGKITTDS